MELPNYDNSKYGTGYAVFRGLRSTIYFMVIILLGYALWRISVIESTMAAQERLKNITELVRRENIHHHRSTRSLKQSDFNSFESMEKGLPRGSLLTSKNEKPVPPADKIETKDDFERMVNRLFFQIQKMHNDTDRSHFDNNIKAVFQAWFPVFDALLPNDITDDQDKRSKREVDNGFMSEFSDVLKIKRFAREIQKSSEESSEEKKPRRSIGERFLRLTRSADKSSEEKDNVGRENSTGRRESSGVRKKDKVSSESLESSESEEKKMNKKKINRSGSEYEVINLVPNFEGDETATTGT